MVIPSDLVAKKANDANSVDTKTKDLEIETKETEIMTKNAPNMNNTKEAPVMNLPLIGNVVKTTQIESLAKYALIMNKSKEAQTKNDAKDVKAEKKDTQIENLVNIENKDTQIDKKEVKVENIIKSARFKVLPKSVQIQQKNSTQVQSVTNDAQVVNKNKDQNKIETKDTDTEIKPKLNQSQIAIKYPRIESVVKYDEIVKKKKYEQINDIKKASAEKKVEADIANKTSNIHIDKEIDVQKENNKDVTIKDKSVHFKIGLKLSNDDNQNFVSDNKFSHDNSDSDDVIFENKVKSVRDKFEPKTPPILNLAKSDQFDNLTKGAHVDKDKDVIVTKDSPIETSAPKIHIVNKAKDEVINKEKDDLTNIKIRDTSKEDDAKALIVLNTEDTAVNLENDIHIKKDEQINKIKIVTIEEYFKDTNDDTEVDGAKMQAKMFAWTKEFESRANFWKGTIQYSTLKTTKTHNYI